MNVLDILLAAAGAGPTPAGTTWVSQPGLATAVGTPTIYSVCWNGSIFVAAGYAFATSPDGVTWTSRTLPTAFSGGGWARSVCWSGSQFVAVGINAMFQGACATSPDGITWTAQAGFTTVFSGQANSVCWNGAKFVAVGGVGQVCHQP